jgi:hypothetical protein
MMPLCSRLRSSSISAPIAPEHRAEFLEAVMTALTPHAVIGEGLVHRTCRDFQKRFINLPRSYELAGGKYGRARPMQ